LANNFTGLVTSGSKSDVACGLPVERHWFKESFIGIITTLGSKFVLDEATMKEHIKHKSLHYNKSDLTSNDTKIN
jgi:hypothetical protein